jgi:hypothetical protein
MSSARRFIVSNTSNVYVAAGRFGDDQSCVREMGLHGTPRRLRNLVNLGVARASPKRLTASSQSLLTHRGCLPLFRSRRSANVAKVTLRSEAGCARRTASASGARDHLGLHRQQSLALQLLAGELAGTADRFRPLPDFALGGFLIMAAELHLAKDALALHLLLQHFESLFNIVVSDENLHVLFLFI